MSSYKFNGIDINVKKFNSVYELTDIHTRDLGRLVVSAAVTSNKSDVRCIVGYKTDDGRVIPFYVKSPANFYLHGVSQCNENSACKMGLDISDHEKWMERYMALWKKIEERLGVVLEIVKKKRCLYQPKAYYMGRNF